MRRIGLILFAGWFSIGILIVSFPAFSQAVWENSTYPDEAGFQQRIADVINKIAAQTFGERSKAHSTCPDTGLPVYTWALEGETIISPYTGTRYIQGETGYFGPKARNEYGQITAFGGDPLKYDLQPATAFLLLNPDDLITKAFLSIPGNMNQQYHFAAKNWARFYPLLSDKMGPEWQRNFQSAVANYKEARRPSDGDREHNWLSQPHDLVGETGELLGGNKLDGGTENHKTMWRTTALVYAEHFPDSASISGYPVNEAKALVSEMIRDYLQRIFQLGNGEYDSQIYYPHSIEAFLNLYDFSKSPDLKSMAKVALDYYLATYGMKLIDGTLAGAQKRGYLNTGLPNEMESLTWAFFGNNSKDMSAAEVSLHQATTSYRPNLVICNLANGNIPLPFTARIARPLYHMDVANQFQETFYRSRNFGLGSVAMTVVDNPTQQVVWSLVATGKEGPLFFGGGQPKYLKPTGHSPYTQTIQHQNTLLVMTGQTGKISASTAEPQAQQRLKYAAAKLNSLEITADNPGQLREFMQAAPDMAASWFFVPKSVKFTEKNGKIMLMANQTYIAVTPFGGNPVWLTPPDEWTINLNRKDPLAIFKYYKVLVIPGHYSGYAIEAFEADEFENWNDFVNETSPKVKLQFDLKIQQVTYSGYDGQQLKMDYQDQKLRAEGTIDGKALDYENWADGGVYDSPVIKIKDGVMKITDGKNSYLLDYTKSSPEFKD